MSALNCNCPGNTALDTIPYNPCKDLFKKDARFIFQRLDDANNLFADATNGIELEASWTGLPDAADGTKVSITPVLEDVTFEEPGILEDGENLDGAAITVDKEPQVVTAMIRNATPAQISALESLMCEENLSFYRIDASGQIMARKVGAADHAGIPISTQTFSVTDPFRGGAKVDQEKTKIKFTLPAGWSKEREIIQPAAGFNPLTEIKPS